ncbi:MAG: HigA family addiction module antitoxin [Bryobacterales bacterium]|nr:HigA family addiction module antitoxin [Bryobacterales bacterium]
MTIEREHLERRTVDFSDVVAGHRLPPVHPGEILREDFLEPLALSVYRLARAINVPRTRLNDIVLGRRSVTVDTALRLGRYFGTTPEFWLNLQTRHDLDVADRTSRLEIEREIEPYARGANPVALDRTGGA